VIWLFNSVFEQNSPTLPTTNTAIIKQNSPTPPANDAAMIKEWVNKTSSANQNESPMTVRRALSNEPSVAPPASPPTTPLLPSYRVVKIGANDFLNLRGGPGETYAAVVRIRAGTGGIRLGESRVRNGSTFWRKISVGPYTGWVNEIYIKPELDPEIRKAVPLQEEN
jgi:hypothetical protein